MAAMTLKGSYQRDIIQAVTAHFSEASGDQSAATPPFLLP